MVYKRYIKRKVNGEWKTFGPYYYESYRDSNGITKTRYILEPKKITKLRAVTEKIYRESRKLFVVLGILCLVVLSFFLLSNIDLTGKAVMSIDQDYSIGEQITGDLKLLLESNEFIPGSTKVVINNAGEEFIFLLSDLVKENLSEGEFYLVGTNVSGFGLGYGISEIEYPKVAFVLDVYQTNLTSQIGEEVVEPELPEEQPQENITEIIENETVEEPQENVTIEEPAEPVLNETEEIIPEIETTETPTETITPETETSGTPTEIPAETITPEVIPETTTSTETESETTKTENKETAEEKETEKETKTEEKVEEKQDLVGEAKEESTPEPTSEPETTITGEIIKTLVNTFNAILSITGNAVIGEEISGEVAYGETFTYDLAENQTARIISSEQDIELTINNNQAIITTNYTGGIEKEILIDLSNLNLTAKEGEFKVSLVYEGTEIVSASKNINVENLTIVNETNITLINETLPLINVSEIIENLTTKQYKAIIGRPVKTLKILNITQIKTQNVTDVNITIPKKATNISVLTGQEIKDALKEIDDFEETVNNTEKEDLVSGTITGQVSLDIEMGENIFSRIWKKISKLSITGKVIDEKDIESSIIETNDNKIVEINEIVNFELLEEVAVGYYTDAPLSVEENLANGKRVTISAPDELNYTDILAYSLVDKQIKLVDAEKKIRLYWYTTSEVVSPIIISNETISETVVSNETAIINESVIEENISNESLEENLTIINETTENNTIIVNETNNTGIIEEQENISENATIVENETSSFSITGQVTKENNKSKEKNNSKKQDIEEINESIILNDTGISDSQVIIQNETSIILNETPIVNNIVRVQVGFDAYDLDNDSYVDYIEWIVPHLSNQTYDIIYITKAEHLDENRTFIEDISDEVKYLDGNWSKPINDSEYVRVTFEIPLDNTRDVTFYGRSATNETSTIEVFTQNGNETLAVFENIQEEKFYKIYLTELNGTQDVFDLKINGSIEFDQILDPAPTIISVKINSTTNASTENIKGYCNATDGDGDDLAYQYQWYNGSTVYFNGTLFKDGSISVGRTHTCGIRANDSRVLCWGDSANGKLGDGQDTINRLEPYLTTDSSAYSSINANYYHTCGIRANDSRVLCWGYGDYGQLGDGSTSAHNVSNPNLTTDSSAYSSVSTGNAHTCGIRANDSRVLCWGQGLYGQLGDGQEIINRTSPYPTTDLSTYISISAGQTHTCGIRANDSRVLCWGNGDYGQLGDSSTAWHNVSNSNLTTDISAYTRIDSGSYHTCSIRANDSRVLCWGANSYGQLGDNSQVEKRDPTLTTDTSAYSSISTGSSHTCGLRTNDSRVLCWGYSAYGRLGDGQNGVNVLNPNLTTDTSAYTMVSAVYQHTCGIRANDSRVLCWGESLSGRLGDGQDGVDVLNPNLTTDTSPYKKGFSSGNETLVSILGNAFINNYENWSLGCRAYDFISYSSWMNSSVMTILSNVAMVSVKINSTTNLSNENIKGYCNATDIDGDDLIYQYQWYNGSTVYINGTLFKEGTISARDQHTCGIRANDSRVLCWGYGDSGRLGDGEIDNNLEPNLTTDFSAYTSVSVGSIHTCGIRANDSRVLCWGDNYYGQLGNGTTTDSIIPILTSDSSAYSSVSAGQYHTCGIRANDSRVLCWGESLSGRLGDGQNGVDVLNPNITTDSSAYSSISAGSLHTCGIRANDSRVLCWGESDYGRLGDGSSGDNLNPNVTTDTSPYTSINAGSDHTCGIRQNDSRVLCWGLGTSGQRGDGQTLLNQFNPNVTTDLSAYASISVGNLHACGIRVNDSRVLCWGSGNYGQLGDGSNASHSVLNPNITTDSSAYSSVSAGQYYTCGIRVNDSRVLCWGYGLYGRLGDGSTTDNLVPNVTTDSSPYKKGFSSGNETLVSILGNAFINNYENWSLGCRAYDFISYSSWMNSSVITGLKTTMISVKINSTTNESTDNINGYCKATDADSDDLAYQYQWYNGSTVFINGTLFKEGTISGGSLHTCGIRANDSRVLCWGNGNYGQLGDGSTSAHNNSNPNVTTDSSAYTSISAGWRQTCGIRTNDSRVLCWGNGDYGQLGDGITSAHNVSNPNLTTDSSAYKSVSAGYQQTCGLRANDSRVLCWGNGDYGQLGDGSTAVHNVGNPNVTTDSSEYLSVNTKGWHTCGIRVNDSRVLCWGYDNHGQLGDGQTANNGNPNITTDSSIYSSVSAGYYHTCGIRTNDSRVLCWGEGDYGQLGDSSTSAHNTLNPNVTTDSSVYTSIDAGGFHTCGIRQNDSRILCWGWGLYGTLGDGQTSNKGNPNVTTDSSAYSSINSGGGYHTCGIRSNDSRVLCWGESANGRLGDGQTTTDRTSPYLTTDSSPYKKGFSSSEEILVSILGNTFLTSDENWSLSCRAYDFVNYSSWMNSSSLMITDLAPPVVLLSAPQNQGFGLNVTLNSNVTDNNLDTVLIGITPPGESETNYSMINTIEDTYEYNFTSYTNGTYAYRIYANDTFGNKNYTENSTFNLFINLTNQIRTLKDNYSAGEVVNLTDPPESKIDPAIFGITNVINSEIQTSNSQVILNESVKWKKNVKLSQDSVKEIEIPKSAVNVNLYKISKEGKKSKITANIISKDEYGNEMSWVKKLLMKINIFSRGITGEAVKEVLMESGEYEMEYETPGPVAIEDKTDFGKRIVITSEVHYENILAYTYLENEAVQEEIRLYRTTNGSRELINVKSYDKNNNGLIDYIEWTVPHLSEQTYELIIEINQAEHLDSDRNFISEIYDKVKELDNIWSEEINEGDYVRIVFETPLNNTRDITIYSRAVSGNPKVEVYEMNENKLIAEFSSINSNEYNKIYLTNLVGQQDTFDLRVIGGSVEFDHIIDPTTSKQYFFSGAGGTGTGVNQDLKELTGSGLALWTSSATADTVTFITQYTQATNVTTANVAWGLWCNKSGSAGGDTVYVDYQLLDCGTNSDCSGSPTVICSGIDLNCDSTTIVYVSGTCTPSVKNTIEANNYLGTRLTSKENKAAVHAVLYFNNTVYPSHINFTIEYQDISTPTYSNILKNDSAVYQYDSVQFNTTWADETDLGKYIFSTNHSGSWQNDSAQSFPANNVSTKILSVTAEVGQSIGWRYYANDTFGYINATPIQTFTVNGISWDQTSINMGNTLENEVINTPTNINAYLDQTNVNVNCYSGDCSVIYSNFTSGGVNSGTKQISFNCSSAINDSYSAQFSVNSNEDPYTHNITVNCSVVEIIEYNNFRNKGNTSNLDNLGMNDESRQLILDDNANGKIVWHNNVTLNATYDLDTAVEISNNFISVNSAMYPNLNAPANITMRNLNLGHPVILKDGVECSDCEILSWNTDTDELIFNVSSFSEYTAEEANQSKLQNNGTTNTSVYLLLQVQKWNGFVWNTNWTIYNSTTPIQMNASTLIKYDSYFNGKWNTTLNGTGVGKYRVTARIMDSQSNTLINTDGTQLFTTYNFSIISSDSILPNVTINTPQNITYQNTTVVFNVTATDDHEILICGYSLDGANNITLTNTIGDNWDATNSSMTSGSHTILFYCKDSAENINGSASVVFSVDGPPAMVSAKINSTTNSSTENIKGYCNATDVGGNDLAYQYQWYNGSTVYFNGTLFKEGSISAGYYHTCGIRANDSRVLCWGGGDYGQLGDGNNATHNTLNPNITTDSSAYVSVIAGGYHTCGIRSSDSRVLCWGRGNEGQLGDSSTAVHEVGNPNVTVDNSSYSSISTGRTHTCGIRTNDSRVLCWGDDTYGQIGNGDTSENLVPTNTTDSSAYTSISAGWRQTCGIRTNDSRVLCWGNGDYGQLGDGSNATHNTLNPNITTDSSVYTSISTGTMHTCGIRANDSRVMCWGQGTSGQLGDGQMIVSKPNPNVTTDSSAYSSVSAGEYHTCGIRVNDSRAMCWGRGLEGELGDGQMIVNKPNPNVTTDSSAYVSINTGEYHTCGIRANDSRVMCWGQASYGQLGDGQNAVNKPNPNITTDASAYGRGFSSSEENLVSTLGNAFLNIGETWSIGCRAYDFTGYSSWMNSSGITIIETNPPAVTINTPLNTTYGSIVIFNVTATDASGISECVYSLDNALNVSMTNITANEWNATNSSMTSGSHNVKFYCNDTSGNINGSLNRTFSVDTIFPSVTINTPLNTTYGSTVVFNVTATDASGIETCVYSLDNALNVSMTNITANEWNATNSSMISGSHNVKFYCNDTAGNINESQSVTFTVDTILPNVTINTPLNTTYTTANIIFNVTANDSSGIETCVYSLDNALNVSMTNLTASDWNSTNSSMTSGSHNVKFYCNDTAGNINGSESVTFTVDANTLPVIQTVKINSTTNSSIENIKGYCNATDGDEDDLAYQYQWYNGSTVYFNGTLFKEGSISMGDYYSCGIRANDSRVLCWGANSGGQLGDNSQVEKTNPTLTTDTSPYASVSTGNAHTCGIRVNDSRVLCWGGGGSGQLGDGNTLNHNVLNPNVTTDNSSYSSISAGTYHTCGIRTNDSRVLCWGYGDLGQLGDSSTAAHEVGNPNVTTDSSAYSNINAGYQHTCGIRQNDSRVLCWGYGNDGQLGDGSLSAHNVGNPNLTTDSSVYSSISTGFIHTCGIRTNDSRVVCWGEGFYGRLGDGQTAKNPNPNVTTDSSAYTKVIAGGYHTCGIRANDSRILCWGWGSSGQLGDSETGNNWNPNLTTDFSAYNDINLGYEHTCGIRANDSRVLCWGQGNEGQLGDGNTEVHNSLNPNITTDTSSYGRGFSSGEEILVSILGNAFLNIGETWKMGCRAYDFTDYSSWMNSSGITILSETTPPAVTINTPLNTTYGLTVVFNVTATDASGIGTCVYSLDNALNVSMTNITSNEWNATNFSMTSGSHNVKFYCNDTNGNINSSLNRTFTVDTTSPNVTINTPLNSTYGSIVIFNVTATDTNGIGTCIYSLDNVLNVSMTNITASEWNATNLSMTSGSHNVKFYCNDSVGNINGSLNVTSTVNLPPAMVSAKINSTTNSSTENIKGYCNATDGEGDDLAYQYQWYNGSTVYFNGTLFKEGSISAGYYHTCGIRANDSRVLCWGGGDYGQLGDGNNATHNTLNPNITTDSSAYVSVIAGGYHTCGIRSSDSRVLCWGRGNEGQLGDSSTAVHEVGNPNVTVDNSSYSSISTGRTHTCGIRTNDSRVLCWGDDTYGQIGNGDTSENLVPTNTTDSSAYTSISAGWRQTCGIRTNDSRVLCWGNGDYGQLGDGSNATHNTLNPNITTDSSVYTSISTGTMHTCGIRANDSRVMCWGQGTSGQLGDGQMIVSKPNPNVTTDSSAYSSVSAGEYHTCGIRVNDSRAMCWGRGLEGELGDGQMIVNKPNPNVTTDSSAYVSINTGEYHTCGIRANDSRVMCWGQASYGQLGDGQTAVNKPNPNITTDSSAYGRGFSSSEEILVSILGNAFLNIGETWSLGCRAYDFIGYSSWMNSTGITIKEINIPEVTINTPLNTTYGLIVVFNVTATDASGIGTCVYSLDNALNVSMTNITSNEWNATNFSMISGSHNVKFYCNDSVGNINGSQSITFSVDANTLPVIQTVKINSTTNSSTENIKGYCNATDGEGDDLAYQYQWYNGSTVYMNGTLFKVGSISSGRDHTCGIRANDSRVLCWGQGDYGQLGDGRTSAHNVGNPNLTTDLSAYSSINAGYYHTCGIRVNDSRVLCWGRGDWGNLGDGSNATHNVGNPNVTTDVSAYTSISAGYEHTCGIRTNDSRVLCWGIGNDGQLGDNSTSAHEVENPNLITDSSAYISVSTGAYHTCGIRVNDSRVLCWGQGDYGQLGDSSTASHNVGNPNVTTDVSAYTSVSTGYSHTCGIRTNDSRILCWGYGLYGQLGDGGSGDNLNSNITTDSSAYASVSAGQYHTCGIRANDSRVLCWGESANGRLGDGQNGVNVLNPNVTTDTSAYTSLSAGYYHTCGIRSNDSRVMCWGQGDSGQLGDNNTLVHNSLNPNITTDTSSYKQGFSSGNETLVSILGNAFIQKDEIWKLSCRAYDFTSYSSWMNSTAMTILSGPPTIISVKINSTTNSSTENINGYCNATDGDGDDLVYQYQWYNGSTIFINGTIFKEGSISMGDYYSCGIRANDSRVLCWGANSGGQLGDNSQVEKTNPTLTTDTSPYASVSTGNAHTCGIRVNDSRVLCWGGGGSGQLGDGNTLNHNVLNPNVTTDNSSYSSISAGTYHTCGIRTNDSRVLCWGYGDLGQLGDSSTAAHEVGNPNVTTDSSAYSNINAGYQHTCGIRQNDSRVLCWGYGNDGQLGDGSLSAHNVGNPNLTTDSSVYSSISTGFIHTCGIRTNDSRVLCWGEGYYGRLGDGQTAKNPNPNLTTDTSAYIKVIAGGYHTCGIRSNDSRVLCWGWGSSGQLGDSETANNWFPNLTTDLSAYNDINLGYEHTCGIRANDSRVLCWGQGNEGQLGDGNTEVHNSLNSNITTDTSSYGRGFSSGEEILVSILGNAYLNIGETWKMGCRAYDFTEYSSWMNSSGITIKETNPPAVTINTPLNTTYGGAVVFNVTATDSSGIGTCIYSLDNALNVSMTNITASEWNATNSSMTSGSHNVKFYCNDTFGNINGSQSVTFTVDANTLPVIQTVKINSTTNSSTENIKGYCNATDDDGDDLAYQYQWYNGSTVYMNGTLFKVGSISAGGYHSCGIRANDSRVLCWGDGSNGQLGDGSTSAHNNPNPNLTTDSSAYSSVSAIYLHTCGIRVNDSRILCWGYGDYGQLGDGQTTSHNVGNPNLTTDTSAYSSVSTGYYHTCGIRANDSRVLCWGESSYGQLGDGQVTLDRNESTLTTDVSAYSSISTGYYHTCGIRANDSRVLCWGDSANGKLGDGQTTTDRTSPYLTTDISPYSSINAGYQHTCGIRLNDSRALCWGYGLYGQLGDGETGDNLNTNLTTDSSAYSSISTGYYHTCGIRTNDSRVLCWGESANGRLGDGQNGVNVLYPNLTKDSSSYSSVIAGGGHTCGIRSNDSRVLCWGVGSSGRLGDGQTALDMNVSTLTTDTSPYKKGFSSGNETLVSILGNAYLNIGETWSLGCRAYDFIDYSSWMNSTAMTILNGPPTMISVKINSTTNSSTENIKGYCNATDTDGDDLEYQYQWYNGSTVYFNGTLFKEGSISAGYLHTCGIRANDSRVLCWGESLYGRLGDGQNGTNVLNPNVTTDSSAYTSVSAGYYNTCGIRASDSRVLCWGSGNYGQLGDNSTDAHTALNPNITTDASPYSRISAGYYYTCGIRQNDSRVLCWGRGDWGNLGDDSTATHNVATPNLTTDISAYSSVNAGQYHTCGIRANDSRVLCWGMGSSGQIGDGASIERTNPTTTSDISVYKSVSAGYQHTCGIRANDSRVLCWGEGNYGQLGDSSTIEHNVGNPNITTDSSFYSSVSAGYYHTCGIRQNDSRVLCWGRGDWGNLGDYSTAAHNVTTPNLTTDISAYSSASAGQYHTCGIRANDSRVLCWGSGTYGQLGDGLTGDHNSTNPNVTTDLSPYLSTLVSILGNAFLNIGETWKMGCRAYDFIDYSSWMNSSEITISSSNEVPNTPTPNLVSVDGTNKTLSNLNCSAVISDPDADTLDVSVRWYKNGGLNQTIDYNNSYANGTTFSAILDDGNTTKLENWTCQIRLYDGALYSEWGVSSNLTILNTLPTVTLVSPNNPNTTTNRTPQFVWSASDDDNDALTYGLNLTCYYNQNDRCESYDRYISGINDVNYIITQYLEALSDNNYYYNWSVKASDDSGVTYGNYALPKRRINIQSNIMLSLVNDTVSFGTLQFQGTADTTTNSPWPFLLQNDGNCLLNVSTNATDLWNSIVNPNNYYKFKVDNQTGEEGSFNSQLSNISWSQMPANTEIMIVQLNWSDVTDSAEIDILVEVPTDEGSGDRSSSVVFTGALGE